MPDETKICTCSAAAYGLANADCHVYPCPLARPVVGVEWRDMPGYEGFYRAGSGGEILSVKRMFAGERILKPFPDRCGYPQVTLAKNGSRETKKVHRLVAEAFLGPMPEGCNVDHINRNRADNRIENLRYLDFLVNCGAKLNEEAVKVIRWAHRAGRTLSFLGRLCGVDRTTIANAVSGKGWSHV